MKNREVTHKVLPWCIAYQAIRQIMSPRSEIVRPIRMLFLMKEEWLSILVEEPLFFHFLLLLLLLLHVRISGIRTSIVGVRSWLFRIYLLCSR